MGAINSRVSTSPANCRTPVKSLDSLNEQEALEIVQCSPGESSQPSTRQDGAGQTQSSSALLTMDATDSRVSMSYDNCNKLIRYLDRSREQEALGVVKCSLSKSSVPPIRHIYLDGYYACKNSFPFVISPLIIALRAKAISVFLYLLKYCPEIVNKLLPLEEPPYGGFKHLHYAICDWPRLRSRHYCSESETLLHLACRLDLVEAVEGLLKSRADTEINGCGIGTALHIAAEHGRVRVMELLLDAGANIEACDVSGNTPLHSAVAWNMLDAVKCLLDRGADITSTSVLGENAFTVAVRRNPRDVLPFLCDNYPSQFFCSRPPKAPSLPPSPPALLLLATLPGGNTQFKKLLDHPDCPHHLNIDARLIQALHSWYSPVAFFKFKRVLEEKQALEASVASPTTPRTYSSWFGDHYEVLSVEECKDFQPGTTSFFIQSCIVLERCIGCIHPVLFNRLNWFIDSHARNVSDFNPATYRQLRLRALEIFVHYEALKFEHLTNAPFNINQFFSDFEKNFMFDPHIELTRLILQGFEVYIKTLKGHTSCDYFKQTTKGYDVHVTKMIDLILIYLHNWINECNLYKLQHSEFSSSSVVLDELREAINQFVQLSHSILKRRSVFHSTWLENVSREGKSKDACLFLLTLLLESDAGSLINMPHPIDRVRPLHYFQRMLWKEGVAVLLSHGAHLDVAGNVHPVIYPGKMYAFEMVMDGTSVSDSLLTSPLPLLCLCSHVIVEEKMPYRKMNLPARIKDYIALHQVK